MSQIPSLPGDVVKDDEEVYVVDPDLVGAAENVRLTLAQIKAYVATAAALPAGAAFLETDPSGVPRAGSYTPADAAALAAESAARTTNDATTLASANAHTDTSISGLATATSVTAEATARTNADAATLTSANAHSDAAVAGLATATSVTAEATARTNADAATLISANAHTDAAVSGLATATSVTAEATARTNADAATLTSANAHTDAAVSGLATATSVTAEATARTNADAATLTSANAHADGAVAPLTAGLAAVTNGSALSIGGGTVAARTALVFPDNSAVKGLGNIGLDSNGLLQAPSGGTVTSAQIAAAVPGADLSAGLVTPTGASTAISLAVAAALAVALGSTTFTPMSGAGYDNASATTRSYFDLNRMTGPSVSLFDLENNPTAGTGGLFWTADALAKKGGNVGSTGQAARQAIFVAFLKAACAIRSIGGYGILPFGDKIVLTSTIVLPPGPGPRIQGNGCSITGQFNNSGTSGMLVSATNGGHGLHFDHMVFEREGITRDLWTNLPTECTVTASFTGTTMSVTNIAQGVPVAGMVIQLKGGSPAHGLTILSGSGLGNYTLSGSVGGAAIPSSTFKIVAPTSSDNGFTLYGGDHTNAVIAFNALSSGSRPWGITSTTGAGASSYVVKFDQHDFDGLVGIGANGVTGQTTYGGVGGLTPTLLQVQNALANLTPVDSWMICTRLNGGTGTIPTVLSVAAATDGTNGWDVTLSAGGQTGTASPLQNQWCQATTFVTLGAPSNVTTITGNTMFVDDRDAMQVGAFLTSPTTTGAGIPAGTRLISISGNQGTFSNSFTVAPNQVVTFGLKRMITFYSTPPVFWTGNLTEMANTDDQTYTFCTWRKWLQGRALQASGVRGRVIGCSIYGGGGQAGDATTRTTEGQFVHSFIKYAGGDQVTQGAPGQYAQKLHVRYEYGSVIGLGAGALAMGCQVSGRLTFPTGSVAANGWLSSTVTAAVAGSNTLPLDGRTTGNGGTIPAGFNPLLYGTGPTQTPIWIYKSGDFTGMPLSQVVSFAQPGGVGTDWICTTQAWQPNLPVGAKCVVTAIPANSGALFGMNTLIAGATVDNRIENFGLEVKAIGQGSVIVICQDNPVGYMGSMKLENINCDNGLCQQLPQSPRNDLNINGGPYGGVEVIIKNVKTKNSASTSISVEGNVVLKVENTNLSFIQAQATTTGNSGVSICGCLPGSYIKNSTITLNGASAQIGDVDGHVANTGELVPKSVKYLDIENVKVVGVVDGKYAYELNYCNNVRIKPGRDPDFLQTVTGTGNTAGAVLINTGCSNIEIDELYSAHLGAAPIVINPSGGNASIYVGWNTVPNPSFPVPAVLKPALIAAIQAYSSSVNVAGDPT